MKKLRIITAAILLCGLFSSCIQKELPNTEADILTCTVPEEILKTDPIIQNKSIKIYVKEGTDLSAISPEFTLTEGASIQPPSGTKRDFSSPQQYTVTSQDGKWDKIYLVTFIDSELTTDYHFENIQSKDNKYYAFVETDDAGKITMEWASGNAGFKLTGAGTSPEAYPTFQSEKGFRGKCVQLVTRSTGSWGAGMGMPIAAGNIFIGTFDVLSALKNPLKATKFGLPFNNVPTYLTGWYKYKAGKEYSKGGKIVDGKKDMCNLYAVFYETDANLKSLDGTNMLTHPNIYSIAKIKEPKESEKWIYFELSFITQPNKTLDTEKLKAGKYNIAIVFTSSVEGDEFGGAIGSTLYVDEVQLLFNKVN